MALARLPVQYHYNSSGLLDSVVDPRGLETAVAYDRTRRVQSITERCGGVTNITSLPSLVTVDLATNGPNEPDLAPLSAYLPFGAGESDVEEAYAGGTHETRVVFGEETKIIRDPFGNVNYIQDAQGTITTYGHSATNGLLTQVIQPDPNDPTDILTTNYYYDSSGRVYYIDHPIGQQNWSYGAFGQVASYSDNERYFVNDVNESTGNVRSTSQWTGSEYLVTSYTYTDGTGTNPIKGLVETITDPNGNITHYTYNSHGLVDTIVYAEGTSDEVSEEYDYDSSDRLDTFTDRRGHVTAYQYDNLDRLTQRTDPDPDGAGSQTSPVWQYYYDPVGNQTHVTDPLGRVTETVYDVRDRPLQVIQPVADPNATPAVATKSDAAGLVTTGTWTPVAYSGAYNGTGEFASTTTGASVQYTFTGLDANKKYAVLAHWTPTGAAWDKNALWQVFGNTSSAPLNEMRADLNVKPQGKPDGSGFMWLPLGAFSPDSGTLTVKLSDDDNNGYLLMDAVRLVEVGPVTQTDYDCNGNLVRVTDPLNHVTQYDYDDLNRLTTRTDPDPDGAGATYTSPVTDYSYNALGWLTSTTDPDGNVTFYQYDELGRQTQEVKVTGAGLAGEYRNSSGALLHTRVDDDLNFAADPDFAGYSDLGNAFTTTWTGAIDLDFTGNPTGQATFYLNSTDSSELYIDGQLVDSNLSLSGDMEETPSGQITLAAGWHTVKVFFEDQHDGADSGLIVSYDLGAGKVAIPATALFTTVAVASGYDDDGRLTSLTDADSNTTTFGYDEADRMTSESIVIDSQTLSRTYKYDGDGNLKQKTDRNGRVTTYQYDHLDHLRYERWYANQAALDNNPNVPSRTIEYQFDAIGNLTDVSDPDATYGYTYDNLDRRTAAVQTLAALSFDVT